MDDETNIVLFPGVHSIEAPPIVIPLDSVEHARAAVDQCMAAFELLQVMLAQVPKHGDAMALHGASRVLGALSCALDNLRTGRQIDPAYAAAVIARVNPIEAPPWRRGGVFAGGLMRNRAGCFPYASHRVPGDLPYRLSD